MKNVLIILFSIFAFGYSNAGVNSVGNGGGLAELEFIFYFNNTDKIVDFCLDSSNVNCQLSDSQKEAWQQLKQKSINLQKQYKIIFASEGLLPWEINNQQLIINSKYLYKVDGSMISESELLSFSLAVQLSLALDISIEKFQSIWLEVIKNLNGFQFDKRTTTVHLVNDISFHQITIFNQMKKISLFVIEESDHSIYLNDIMQSQQPAFDIANANFYQILGVTRPDKVIFYGMVNLRHFKIEAFYKAGTSEIDPDRILFNLSIE